MTSLLYNNIQYTKDGIDMTIKRLRDYQERSVLYKSIHPANKNIVDLTVLKPLIKKQINSYNKESYVTHIDSIMALQKLISNMKINSVDHGDIFLYSVSITTEVRRSFNITKMQYIDSILKA